MHEFDCRSKRRKVEGCPDGAAGLLLGRKYVACWWMCAWEGIGILAIPEGLGESKRAMTSACWCHWYQELVCLERCDVEREPMKCVGWVGFLVTLLKRGVSEAAAQALVLRPLSSSHHTTPTSPPTITPPKRRPGRGLYHCDYCRRDLSSVLHIRCTECADFDLCLDCFSVGAAVAPHKPWHAYRLAGSLSFPLYERDWGADEEMLLLEAVELYGLGNWEAVAEHVGRAPAEARRHYMSVFVETGALFPDPAPQPDMAGVDVAALIEAHARATGDAAAARIADMPSELADKRRGAAAGGGARAAAEAATTAATAPTSAAAASATSGSKFKHAGQSERPPATAPEHTDGTKDEPGPPAAPEGDAAPDGDASAPTEQEADDRVPVEAGRQLALDPALVAADPLLSVPSVPLDSEAGAKVCWFGRKAWILKVSAVCVHDDVRVHSRAASDCYPIPRRWRWPRPSRPGSTSSGTSLSRATTPRPSASSRRWSSSTTILLVGATEKWGERYTQHGPSHTQATTTLMRCIEVLDCILH